MRRRAARPRWRPSAVEVPEAALEAYEAALSRACATVGFFLDDEDARTLARRGRAATPGEDEAALAAGAGARGRGDRRRRRALQRAPTEAEGWLART